MGQSTKLALDRAVGITKAARERLVTDSHLLLGLVAAEVGIVPRVLDQLGVSRAEIRVATLRDTTD